MKTKGFATSDSVNIKTAVGFQPDWIYIGTGGTMVIHTDVGDDVTITVYDGTWWPGDNILHVNATNTSATGFIAWQE